MDEGRPASLLLQQSGTRQLLAGQCSTCSDLLAGSVFLSHFLSPGMRQAVCCRGSPNILFCRWLEEYSMPLANHSRPRQMGTAHQLPRGTATSLTRPASAQQSSRSHQQQHKAATADAPATSVDQTLNPLVAALSVSKTMALTDLARSMKESGIDVSILGSISEPSALLLPPATLRKRKSFRPSVLQRLA